MADMNKTLLDELYKKEIELHKELQPLKYWFENKPQDVKLKQKIKLLSKQREALKVVMNMYQSK